METLIIMLLLPLPILVEHLSDPAANLWQSKAEARNLQCERMTQEAAHERYPGHFPEPPARRLPGGNDALVCTRRVMDLGDRPARDEAILSTLRKSVGELTEAAAAHVGSDVTWHVDAFYPSPKLASKISVAARTALAEGGRSVSDRVPLLAAGDIDVLSELGPGEAYPLACQRYFAQGILGEKDVFLGVMIVDPRETQLHAGLCAKGTWRWLQ